MGRLAVTTLLALGLGAACAAAPDPLPRVEAGPDRPASCQWTVEVSPALEGLERFSPPLPGCPARTR